ncbi:Adhesive plaque matrix protein [Folsomia candida]|uniref:Adhesive plaque matrix protein n=1 Tax=Folsomia candida TaxID=158441 RepID=A0A226ECB2_FOLCA|nr:Adhesive plaque matrix protein [Folsomia candida]
MPRNRFLAAILTHKKCQTTNPSVPSPTKLVTIVETVPEKSVKKADSLPKPELAPAAKINQLETKTVLEVGEVSEEQELVVESDLSSSNSTFPTFHSSGESRSSGKPDMTWILRSDCETGLDLMEESVKENAGGNERWSLSSNQEFSEISRLLSLVTMLGRLPFVIYKETDTFRCRKKPPKGQWDLYLLTCILGVALFMSTFSVFAILSIKVEANSTDSNSQYAIFEKLLFQKHWLHITVFLLTFIVALVGNVSVILYGNHISKYINDVGESLEDFQYKNASKGTRTMKFAHLFITALDVVVLVAFFFTSDLGFQESVKFETILYLRWGLKEAFLDIFWMNIAVYVVLFFEIYVYFVARNHLLLIMVLCRAITNTAHGWNSKTTFLLGTKCLAILLYEYLSLERGFRGVSASGDCGGGIFESRESNSYPRKCPTLLYKTLLKQHLKITKLIEEISNCATPLLFSYFSTRVLCICCELFRASTAFFFDLTLKHVNGSETISGNSGVHKSRKKGPNERKASLADKGGPENLGNNKGTQAELQPEERKIPKNPASTPKRASISARRHNHEITEEEEHDIEKFFRKKPHNRPEVKTSEAENPEAAARKLSAKKVSNPKTETVNKPPRKSEAKHNFPKFDAQELHDIEKFFVHSQRKSVSQPPIVETDGHKELEEKPVKKSKNNAAPPELNPSVPNKLVAKVETVPIKLVEKKADSLLKPELVPAPEISEFPTKSVLEVGQGSEKLEPVLESDLSSSSISTFPTFHSSGESRSSGKPDMTWILRSDRESDLDLMEESVKENQGGNEGLSLSQDFSGISRLLSLVTMLGRLPFVIYKETDAFRCKKKPPKGQWDLYLLTCILGVALFTSSFSVFAILSAKVDANATDSSSQYATFEKLLFQKHWLHITVFLLTLFVALVGNVSVILYGNHISKYINDLGESLEDFQYKNASRGTRTMKFVHLFITTLDVIVLVALFFTSDLGFQESVKFETILYLRWGLKEAFLDNFWMNIAVYVVLFFEIYVYFVARNHLLLIMVLCRSITNTAHGWNSRTTVLLGTVAPQNRAKSMKPFDKPLSYKTLLKQHHKITKLIEGISNCSTPVLFSYFLTRVLCISCEMFRASTAFFFDLTLKHVNGSETISGNSGVHVKYDPTELESIVETLYFLSTTLISVFVVISTISAVGETVMHGFEPVRRYGLLLADSLKGRKFIMSLYMSFNAKRPHIVNPGSWFLVNKSLFLSIVGTALLLFSIMIQWNVVNLVETPIVLACPHDTTQLCVKESVLNTKTEDVQKHIDANAGATFEIPKTSQIMPTTSETPSTITPTKMPTTVTSVTIRTDNPTIMTTEAPTTIRTTQSTPTTIKTTQSTPTTVRTTQSTPTTIKTTPTTPTTIKTTSSTPTTIRTTPSTPTTIRTTPSTPTTIRTTPSTPTTIRTTPSTPTTIKTTSSTPTTITPKPPCPNGKRVVKPAASIQEKTKLCGINCPMSRGPPIAWCPSPKPGSHTPVYDCFGNCHIERDALGRFAFSLHGKRRLRKHQHNVGEFSFEFECFSENVHSPYFNPLEVCGIPYAYTHMLYDYYISNHNRNFAITTLGKMFAAFPNNHKFDVGKAECGRNDFHLSNPTEHDHLAVKVNVTYKQVEYSIWRLIPYSFVYSGVIGLPVPFWWEGEVWESAGFHQEPVQERSDRLFAYPYSYMEPIFTSRKHKNKTIDRSAISSFGMHDCFGKTVSYSKKCEVQEMSKETTFSSLFLVLPSTRNPKHCTGLGLGYFGIVKSRLAYPNLTNKVLQCPLYTFAGNPLDQFDDCGGLPFWLFDHRVLRKPEKVSVAAGKGKYTCWESWIPGYTCGVPSKEDKLIEHVCETWRIFVSRRR